MIKNNMPLQPDELAKMNAFDALWEVSKDHLQDAAMLYKADPKIDDLSSKPMVRKITYDDMIKNIIRVYHALKENGVKKGDVVTYSSIVTPELIYTAYACILLGCIFKPIDIRFNSEQLLSQFEQTPSKLFVGSKPFVDRILPVYGDLGVEKIVLTSFTESLPAPVRLATKLQGIKNAKKESRLDKCFTTWNSFVAVSTDGKIPASTTLSTDPIHLTATTGTTGTPKQLLHNSSNWNAQLYNASHCGLKFERGEKLFNCNVPWVTFSMVNVIHTFICNGIVMEMDPLWTAERNAQFIVKSNPEWWLGAPGWLDELFCSDKYKNADLSNAKYFITGGAPLYPHKHIAYQKRLSSMSKRGIIAPGYGFSEATAAVTTDVENKAYTIGRAWPLLDISIRDYDTGKILPKGTPGELWVSSKRDDLSQIAIGYCNNEAANKEVFVTDDDGKRWAKSGDKVVENDDGTITWMSRYKSILTFNGFNINCEKIAERVQKVPGASKVAVIGCVTGDGNQMPIICVELDKAFADKSDCVVSDIGGLFDGGEFPDYYKPRDIVCYEKFPVISMKTDIQSLKRDLLNENGEYKKG